jgi:hypothetical protein
MLLEKAPLSKYLLGKNGIKEPAYMGKFFKLLTKGNCL